MPSTEREQAIQAICMELSTRGWTLGGTQLGDELREVLEFHLRTMEARLAAAAPASPEPGGGGLADGEVCKRCGRPVAETCPTYWHAPDALWLEVEGGPGGIHCIPCFTRDAAARGITVHWRALRDDHSQDCWCTWDEWDGTPTIVRYHPRCPQHESEAAAPSVPAGDEREEAHLAAVVAMHRRELLAFGQYAAIVHPEDLPVGYRPGMKLMERVEPVPARDPDPMVALLAAYRRVRDRHGPWVRGAPSHVLAKLLGELEQAGWRLVPVPATGRVGIRADAERAGGLLAWLSAHGCTERALEEVEFLVGRHGDPSLSSPNDVTDTLAEAAARGAAARRIAAMSSPVTRRSSPKEGRDG